LNKEYDIAWALNNYFKEFYYLIEGMPESEPMLECKTLLKYAERNWKEQREYRERLDRLRKLAAKQEKEKSKK
jgi:hypothetical protein